MHSLSVRWSQHCAKSSNCPKLSSAIKKYGKENFIIEIIQNCSNTEELNKRERFYIKELNSINKGYNLTVGGEFSTKGYKHTKESKNKMSKARKGKSYEEIYGKEQAEKLKTMKSKEQSGDKNINYGKEGSLKLKKRWQNPTIREDTLKNMAIAQNKPEVKFKVGKAAKKMWDKKLKNNTFNVYEAIQIRRGGDGGKSAIYEKGKLVGEWYNRRECANDLDIGFRHISSVLNSKMKQYKGYIFEYTENENEK